MPQRVLAPIRPSPGWPTPLGRYLDPPAQLMVNACCAATRSVDEYAPPRRMDSVRLDFGPDNPDLSRVLHSLHLVVFTLESGGRFRGWSEGARILTGYSEEEVLGQPWALLDSELPNGLGAIWRELQNHRVSEFTNGVVTLRLKDGSVTAFLGDVRPLVGLEAGPGAGPGGVVGALTLYEPHLLANRRLAVVLSGTGSARRVFHRMVGESEPMRVAFEELEQAADVDVTVLIRGETGTGKELAAGAIHALSQRREGPLVCINCSAIPEPLLESELFGHVKGAFTGATRDKPGVFEEAAGGVLFLDEIGDLGPRVQVKLLRALQEREVRRVGGNKTIKVDVRIVSATNRDLAAMVASGEFREDLYYRIRVFELALPPLRERSGDLPLLVAHFIEELARRHDKAVVGLSDEAAECVERYPWPGNIRELRNAIEHAFVTVRGSEIEIRNLPAEVRLAPARHAAPAGPPPRPQPEASDAGSVEEERVRILAALREAGGRKSEAAALLGISRVTLWKKIKRFGINAVYLD